MSKISIIVKREFMYRVKKRSFFLLTILMPFLFVAVIFVPLLLSSIKDDTKKEVAVVDRTGKYAPLFKNDESFNFVNSDRMKEEYRDPEGDIYAVISIWDDLVENPQAARIYSTTEVSRDLLSKVNSVLGQKIRDDRLLSYGIPDLKVIIEKCNEEYEVQTVKWTEHGGEEVSSTDVAMGVGLFFTILIYMFVLSYGGMVMQSVMEEKTNRIMEIMVSSVKPFTLMMGKIIGVALVGLFQILVWAVLVIGIITVCSGVFGLTADPQNAMTAMGPETAATGIDSVSDFFAVLGTMNFVQIILLFILYFIGGYLFYASFFAAMGSAVNSQEDSSQFMMPMIIVMLFALYAGFYSAENPDGPLAFWCSMFPLTSPIVMMVRLPFDVPLWQELLSLALLFGTALAMVWLAGKIYRVGVLMYGKKPSIREIMKWISYK